MAAVSDSIIMALPLSLIAARAFSRRRRRSDGSSIPAADPETVHCHNSGGTDAIELRRKVLPEQTHAGGMENNQPRASRRVQCPGMNSAKPSQMFAAVIRSPASVHRTTEQLPQSSGTVLEAAGLREPKQRISPDGAAPGATRLEVHWKRQHRQPFSFKQGLSTAHMKSTGHQQHTVLGRPKQGPDRPGLLGRVRTGGVEAMACSAIPRAMASRRYSSPSGGRPG